MCCWNPSVSPKMKKYRKWSLKPMELTNWTAYLACMVIDLYVKQWFPDPQGFLRYWSICQIIFPQSICDSYLTTEHSQTICKVTKHTFTDKKMKLTWNKKLNCKMKKGAKHNEIYVPSPGDCTQSYIQPDLPQNYPLLQLMQSDVVHEILAKS